LRLIGRDIRLWRLTGNVEKGPNTRGEDEEILQRSRLWDKAEDANYQHSNGTGYGGNEDDEATAELIGCKDKKDCSDESDNCYTAEVSKFREKGACNILNMVVIRNALLNPLCLKNRLAYVLRNDNPVSC
jgi:hypothetical protein